MGFDLLAAVAVVAAVVMVRGAWRMIRVARRVRRQVLAACERARRGDTVVFDARWLTNQHHRRRLWRSIASADRAVTAARAAGVPTGDLGSVLRQLRTAATAVDAGLASPSHSPQLLAQAEALVRAAEDVARAAADAVAADTAPLIARVVDAVRLELAALR